MNTPNNLPQAKPYQANHPRILSFLLVGLTVVLVLAAVVITRTNGNQASRREDIAAVVSYSNALEMQYAQPWLDAQNKGTVHYSNALEMQYAQNKVAIPYSNALEMQYAQPWLDAQKQATILYVNALELQYAQPWLDAQSSLDCHSRLDLFYACQYGLRSNGK